MTRDTEGAAVTGEGGQAVATGIVTGPARATNALLLVIGLGTTLALGAAVDQLATTLLGLGAFGAYLLALRVVAVRSPVRTVVGSTLTLASAIGLGVFVCLVPLLAYEASKDAPGVAQIVVTTTLRTVTPWLTVGSVVCLVAVSTDELRRDAVATTLESLLTGLVLLGAALVGVLASREGVLAVESLVTAVVAAARRVETHSHLSELGALVALVALAVALAVAVASLPRYEYARRRLGRRVRALLPDADDARSASGESSSGVDGGGADLAGETGRTDAATTASPGAATLTDRLPTGVLPWTAVLWVEGLSLLVAGALQTPGTSVADTIPGLLGGVGDLLGAVATAGWLRAAVVWGIAVLVALGVVHAVVTRLVHVPWDRYRSRLAQSVVPVLLVAAGVVAAPGVVDTVRRTPSIHYASVALPDGTSPRFTPSGIRLTEAPPGASGLYRSSEGFLAMLRFAVDLVGPAPLVLGPLLGLAVLGAWVVVAGRYVTWPAVRRLSSPGVLAGWLLFGSALAAAALRVSPVLVLLAGVGAVLTWDLQSVSRQLARQFDPRAKTLRGEVIRAGGSGLVLAVGAVLAVGGTVLSRSLAAVDARPSWQLLVVQVCAVVGTAIALAYLSYRGD